MKILIRFRQVYFAGNTMACRFRAHLGCPPLPTGLHRQRRRGSRRGVGGWAAPRVLRGANLAVSIDLGPLSGCLYNKSPIIWDL